MSWKGESRRHSLARKGVKTNIDSRRRFDVSNFVARGNIDKKFDIETLHDRIYLYANMLGIQREDLDININIWGHWDASNPVIHLVQHIKLKDGGYEDYNLTEGKTIQSIEEMDEFVKDLAIRIGR